MALFPKSTVPFYSRIVDRSVLLCGHCKGAVFKMTRWVPYGHGEVRKSAFASSTVRSSVVLGTGTL